METGSVFLYSSILFGALSLCSLIFRDLKDSGKAVFFDLMIPHAGNLIRATAIFISIASGLLIYYLASSDFSVHYVWQYTSRDLPMIYKISAFWTGEAGSLMFLAWVILLMASWLSERHGHEVIFMRRIQIIVLLMGILFLAITALLSPFTSSLEGGLKEIPDDGAGLNPLLVNKWMIFHPPGIFIPYGILAVVFASAFVHLINGNKEWEKWEEFARPFGRAAWIVLGAGMVAGVMWSYEVWESYWIWDPAFTSILMTWLLLTAYLHSSGMKALAPALAVNNFVLAVYSTYIIRSGTIQSAHAFGEGRGIKPLLIAFILIAVISEGLLSYRLKENKENTTSKLLSRRNYFYAAITLLAGLSFILFWGLTSSLLLKSFGAMVSVNLYETWSYPFSLALVAVLGICMFGKHGKKGIFFGAALVLVFLVLKPAQSIYTNLSASVLAFAGLSSTWRIFKSLNAGSMRSCAPYIVHLGIAVMLTGVLMSTYAASESVLFMNFGEKKTVGGYEIQLADLSFPVEHKHAFAVLTKIGVYNIYKDGVLVDSGEASFREIKGEFITQPFIYRGLLADVNVRYQGIGTESPVFISVANVRVIPGMTILWLGSILAVCGAIPVFFPARRETYISKEIINNLIRNL